MQLLQQISDLRNSGCCAGFILLASRGAADANGSNHFIARFDRQSSLRSDRTFDHRRRRSRRGPCLCGIAGRALERQCRIGFASAVFKCVGTCSVPTHLNLYQPAAIQQRQTYPVAIGMALL